MSQVIVSVIPQDRLTQRRTGRALVGISLASRTTQSQHLLKLILDWTRERLGSFDLLVGDYLNRHNYIALNGLAERDAIGMTRRNSAQVVSRLRQLVADDEADAPSIISSESLYGAPTFRSRLSHFEELYEANRAFRALIDEAVDAFLGRKHRSLRSSAYVRGHCVAYQLEELAMFELLAASGHDALVYAGAQLPVMKAIVSGILGGASTTLEPLLLVELRFIDTGTA